jgi:hypothetical protein
VLVVAPGEACHHGASLADAARRSRPSLLPLVENAGYARRGRPVTRLAAGHRGAGELPRILLAAAVIGGQRPKAALRLLRG